MPSPPEPTTALLDASARRQDPTDPLTAVRTRAAQLDPSGELGHFVDVYYRGTPDERLRGRTTEELVGAASLHHRLLQRFDGESLVELYNPDPAQLGWRSPDTLVLVVAPDIPFVIDTLTLRAERCGLAVRLLVHALSSPGRLAIALHVERLSDEMLAGVRLELIDALSDVDRVVRDWPVMRGALQSLGSRLEGEEAAFVRWMCEDHFVLVGMFGPDGNVAGVNYDDDELLASSALREVEVDQPRAAPRVVVARSLHRSPVHREARLDLLLIAIDGERWLFNGLFTAELYSGSVLDVPMLREVVARVHERTGWAPGTHQGNVLRTVLEQHPRRELLELGEDDLAERASALVDICEQRREVGLYLASDRFARTWSALVLIPRDRFDTRVRGEIIEILETALHGKLLEQDLAVGDAAHARLHCSFRGVLDAAARSRLPLVRAAIDREVRAWTDELRDETIRAFGAELGVPRYEAFRRAFPADYEATTSASVAVADIRQICELDASDGLAVRIQQALHVPDGVVQLSIHHRGDPITLSELLPILHNLGLQVIEERAFDVELNGHAARIIRLEVRVPDVSLIMAHADTVVSLFRGVWRGDIENDGLNRLALIAGLTGPEISMVRAYLRYLRQIGVRFEPGFIIDTLVAHASTTASLVALFTARFDPDVAVEGRVDALVAEVDAALSAIESLDEDRVLRSLLGVIVATVRTNYFRRDPQGERLAVLSLKLDPTAIVGMPLPRPQHEIFVYSPRCEGVHLRAGSVARGGLRHSDRLDDYRTEVLQLMKAQVVKNSIIVPTGAKGGFVCRQLPNDRGAAAAEVQACYRLFVGGLLDVTDNLVNGEPVPPPLVRRFDSDDAYLVVAADKGTATFSDVANEVAATRHFWLGDGFASGGSEGYDHKAMGITARGAWRSVIDHLHHRGIDPGVDGFSAVGVGDMSGDVFGNGMLLSRNLKLLAAFDHRHIFIDPDPDPEASFEERARLFALTRSSWADYEPALLSPGGAVYTRASKLIELSPEAWQALALPGEPRSLNPHEVIRAILAAPVDLLWNGGIGTYVKAASESHFEVGDKANDELRVDASALRCRTVGEGGNLGFTQRARIEFAAAGGRIFADAVDNSAGVNCSDHEVNIKILLDGLVNDGQLTVRHRNELLVSMTEEVAAAVLADNKDQAIAIDNAVAEAAVMVNVHRDQVSELERSCGLDRNVEALPSDAAFVELAAGGRGLTAPELAVLMAATKNAISGPLAEADLAAELYFEQRLIDYFPPQLRERFRSSIVSHPLRREITSTWATNRLVHRAGVSIAHRLIDETAATAADVVRAHAVAWELLDGDGFWASVESLPIGAGVATALRLAHRRMVERATRWLLRNRPVPLDVTATISELRVGVERLAPNWLESLTPLRRLAAEVEAERWQEEAVPVELATAAARFATFDTCLVIVDAARRHDVDVTVAAATHVLLDELLGLEVLADAIDHLPRRNRWQSLARLALRDDLGAAHGELTGSVLRMDSPDGDVATATKRWRERNERLVSRWRGVIADLPQGGPPSLEQLSVTVREFRNLLHHVGVTAES